MSWPELAPAYVMGHVTTTKIPGLSLSVTTTIQKLSFAAGTLDMVHGDVVYPSWLRI